MGKIVNNSGSSSPNNRFLIKIKWAKELTHMDLNLNEQRRMLRLRIQSQTGSSSTSLSFKTKKPTHNNRAEAC